MSSRPTARWVKFGEIAEFRNGISFPASARGGNIRIIGVSDFSKPQPVPFEDLETLSEDLDLNPADYLQDGDLLFVRSNGNRKLIGRCMQVSVKDGDRVTHSGFTIRARLTGAPAYETIVAEFFRLGLAKRQFVVLGSGTNISNLNQGVLNDVELLLPCEPSRVAIEELVARFKSVESNLEQIHIALRRRKAGLMRDLLTGRRRFPEFRGKWKEFRLGDVTVELNLRNQGVEDRRLVYSVTNSRGMKPMSDSTIGVELDRYKVCSPDAFAYNPMRLNIGSISRWTGTHDVLVSPDYVVFRCTDRMIPAFADQFRQGPSWARHLHRVGDGSVRVRIYYRDLAQMPLRLPNLAEQRKIAEVLATADREIALLEQLRDAIERQKRGLMQRLLTGEMPLPESLIAKLNAEVDAEPTEELS